LQKPHARAYPTRPGQPHEEFFTFIEKQLDRSDKMHFCYLAAAGDHANPANFLYN
jgi:hypothetical protein